MKYILLFLFGLICSLCMAQMPELPKLPKIKGPLLVEYEYKISNKNPLNKETHGNYILGVLGKQIWLEDASDISSTRFLYDGEYSITTSGPKTALGIEGYNLGQFPNTLYLPFEFAEHPIYASLGVFVNNIKMAKLPKELKETLLAVGDSNCSVQLCDGPTKPLFVPAKIVFGKSKGAMASTLDIGVPGHLFASYKYSDYSTNDQLSLPKKISLTSYVSMKDSKGKESRTVPDKVYTLRLLRVTRLRTKIKAPSFDSILSPGVLVTISQKSGESVGVTYNPARGTFKSQLSEQISRHKDAPIVEYIPSEQSSSRVPLILSGTFGGISILLLILSGRKKGM
jgi:hypothetical protein